ncbi:hypothetical protein [Microbulbifer sp. JMSA002]|uniref:hypothetical protein n=1 Tax=Microbulbifer sp. JMSA002 TaxID=3243368 RepID=UPI00403995EE
MSQDKTEAVMCEAMISVVAHMFIGLVRAGVSREDSGVLISYVCHESTDTEPDSKALFEAGKARALATDVSELGVMEASSDPEVKSADFITTATMIAQVATCGLKVGISPLALGKVVNYLIKMHSHSEESESDLRSKAQEISAEQLIGDMQKMATEQPSDDTPEVEVELEAADS